MIEWLKSLFQKGDPTAYNCEVYIHLPTAELIVVNADAEIECNTERFTVSDIDGVKYDNEKSKLTFTMSRDKLEYLGQL